MWTLHLVCFLTLLATLTAAEDNVAVTYGMIRMKMRSRSPSSRNEFLFAVLSQTGRFLDEILAAEFVGTSYEFSYSNLAVNRAEVTAEDETYDAEVDLLATAVFATNSTPPATELRQVVERSFDESNTRYLQLLTTSQNAYLNDLTFALVTVDGVVVAETDDALVDDNDADSAQEEPTKPQGSSILLQPWMIATIAVGGTLLLVVVVCFVCVCCTPVNDHHLPTVKPSVQTQEDTDSDEDGRRSPRSPSPLASIGSQDSSAFTYNPPSKGSVENVLRGFFGGPASANSFGSQAEVDVEAWQRGSTVSGNTTLPFGHDISAIENKRDLSLIEEGDEEATPPIRYDKDSRSSRASSSRLSQSALQQMERAERRERQRINLNGSARAVIDDLNDLSAQIDDYRHR